MRCCVLLLTIFTAAAVDARGQQSDISGPIRTEVVSETDRSRLAGKHKFQLHWISWNRWKDFADLTVVERGGTLSIKARQQKAGDYVEIDGVITRVEKNQFTFQGSIVTRVSYKNNGNPCKRDGPMTFKITGKRKYWRLQEMQSPCDETTDYVDIFLR